MKFVKEDIKKWIIKKVGKIYISEWNLWEAENYENQAHG